MGAVFVFIIPFVGEEGGGRHEGTTVRSMLLRGGMEIRSLERTSIQPRAAILAAEENRPERPGEGNDEKRRNREFTQYF